jgi:ribosomal protein S18 acetylase RimI-like enzyme
MYDITMKAYWRGALDYLVDIDIKSYDEVWAADKLHKFGRNIRVCVMDTSDEIVGFYMVNVQADRLGRIIKFAVKPSWRRSGIGTAMMNDLLLEAWELETLSAMVDEYNLPAQLFLKDSYFRLRRQLRGPDGNCNYLFTRPTPAQPGEV